MKFILLTTTLVSAFLILIFLLYILLFIIKIMVETVFRANKVTIIFWRAKILKSVYCVSMSRYKKSQQPEFFYMTKFFAKKGLNKVKRYSMKNPIPTEGMAINGFMFKMNFEDFKKTDFFLKK